MTYKFDIYDYVVLTLVLGVSVAIGFYHALQARNDKRFRRIFKRQIQDEKNVEFNKVNEYLIAGSSMSAIPIGFSLLATYFSSTALIGLPAETYQYGIEFWIHIFAIMITPVIGAFVTGPMFANLKIVSIFEYFKIRYGSEHIRLFGTSMYIIRAIISTAIFIFGPATTITALTSIDTVWAVVIIGAVATLYTAIGGIKAVIWTDLFQMIVMFGGVAAVLVKGTIDVGGLGEVLRINSEGGRLNLFDFNPDPFIRQSFWSLTFGVFILFFGSYCVDQQMLQRFSAAKSRKHAQMALLLNVPGILLLLSICCFCGLVIYANYVNCDPLSAPQITNVRNPNQIMVYLVTDKMSVIKGFVGLFVSSIISGSLSSVSSSLNSMAAIIWQDFLKQFGYFRRLPDKRITLLIKLIVFITGIISTAFAILVSSLKINLIQITSLLNGAISSPIIGTFLLAGLCPFSNAFGALFGMICGLLVGVWLSFGAFILKPDYVKLSVNASCYVNTTIITPVQNSDLFYKEITNLSGFSKVYALSPTWFCTVGVVATIATGLILSLLTGGCKNKANEDVMLYRCVIKRNSDKSELKLSSKSGEKIRL